MVQKIKGKNYETVVVTDSDTTISVDKKASIYGGGKLEGSGFTFGFGIIEDTTMTPDVSGNTYKIDGRIKALLGGVTTHGDDTTIKLGKTADITAALGIGLTSFDFSDPEALLKGLSLGSVSASGDNSKIIISKGASVTGLIGASIFGSDSSITNSGDLSGALVGIIAGDVSSILGGALPAPAKLAPGPTLLTNNGHIDAAVGMVGFSAGGDFVIENGKKGEIVGYFMGIVTADALGTGYTEINNAGTIRVTMSIPDGLLPIPGLSSAAIFGYGTTDTITNTGKIYGDVILLDGSDTLDNSHGKIFGGIFGGTGDDTLIVGSAKDKLVELDGEGDDTVKSSFTYTLSDHVENLVLLGKGDINGTGNAGDNVLTGNKGDNVLTGGAGLDTFIFMTKGGHDTIADFTVADDTLNLSGWKGVTDLAFLGGHAVETDGDVVITVGKDVLVIADHTIADLATANIIYSPV